uniref:Uncharacterized protein n=1 Tax=Romanomermis culicivorax TaxID=13658 RepID=A0A915IGQ1_ROMCU
MSICLNRRTDFGRGVKNTSKRRKSRIFWTLVFFCCLATFIYLALALFFKYLKFDKTTQIDLEFRNAPFPAVTFCNLSPYKASEAAKVDSLNRVISSFNDASAKLAPNEEAEKEVPKTRKVVQNRKKRQIWSSTSEEEDKSNRFVPVYAHCNCPREPPIRAPIDDANHRSRRVDPTIAACTPTMNEPNTFDHQCLCIFDQLERKPWLCYDLDHWSKRQCTKCELTIGRHGRCPTGLDSRYAGLAASTIECICPKATTSCLEGLEPYGKLWTMGKSPVELYPENFYEPLPDPPDPEKQFKFKMASALRADSNGTNESETEREYPPIQFDSLWECE